MSTTKSPVRYVLSSVALYGQTLCSTSAPCKTCGSCMLARGPTHVSQLCAEDMKTRGVLAPVVVWLHCCFDCTPPEVENSAGMVGCCSMHNRQALMWGSLLHGLQMRIIHDTLEIINLLTDKNPVQVLVDAIINRWVN